MRLHISSVVLVSLLGAAMITPKTLNPGSESLQAPLMSAKTFKHNPQLLQANSEGLGFLNTLTSLAQKTQLLQQINNNSFKAMTSLMMPALKHHLLYTESMKFVLNDLGVSEDILKPILNIAKQAEEFQPDSLYKQLHSWHIKTMVLDKEKDKDIVENSNKLHSDNHQEEQSNDDVGPSINDKFLQLVHHMFEEEFGGLETILRESSLESPMSSNNMSTNIWMLIKSTWQRLLAYVEEENSIEAFMQHTPVKIIDKVMNLGDEINLMNFLANKLDPDFARFLVAKTDPYLGSMLDFATFYNMTKDYGINGFLEYFTSEKFTSTLNMLSHLVSAYLEDRISGDLINQYIELISFDNPELRRFYQTILKKQKHSNTTTNEDNTNQRFRRDVLEHIASIHKSRDPRPDGTDDDWIQTISNTQSSGSEDQYDVLESREFVARDGYGYGGGGHGGGYGGSGGYGGTSYLDPYILLGALALGTLLGFLLFRLLNGTANGRRDIGDGSLSLWDSDLPDQMLPWGSSVERMKRQVEDNTHSFSLPPSLRGDIWSSDPMVADNLLDDHLDEDDIAHHLNHLWHLYRDTNETACIHSHLCHVMANTTAHHLTGKESSLPLLMASVSGLMGVVRSGQLVDHVTQSMVLGHTFTCPTPFPTCTSPM